MEDIFKYNNIVIFSGAGVSTNSGIPDYRSSGGLFEKLSKEYNISSPELLFSCIGVADTPGHVHHMNTSNRNYLSEHPEIKENNIYLEFQNKIKNAEPTSSHYLSKILNDKGKLVRVYTQNVDGLYSKTGLSEDKIVEFHGSIQKDNVVLYGDPIPDNVLNKVKEDLVDNVKKIDCIIVMGSSLQVAPFCALPNMVTKTCCRILVDKYPNNCFTNNWSNCEDEPSMYSSYKESSYMNIMGRKVTLRPHCCIYLKEIDMPRISISLR